MLKDILGNQKNRILSPECWGRGGGNKKFGFFPFNREFIKENDENVKYAYFDVLSPFKCNHLNKNALAYRVGNFVRNTMMLSIFVSTFFFMEL